MKEKIQFSKAMIRALTNHFRSWREWELNPVVVKELRQAVRSWAVTGMLLLFLAVLFCTSLIFLVGQTLTVSVDQRLGAEVFQSFTAILCFASMLFIPLYIGIRLAAERQENNMDLLYITTLTPQRIIRGKFLCGAYMAVLFFSACMPFMAFTNLLRGVDLPTVAFILLCLFLAVCCVVQAGIFVACLPVSRMFKILLALVGIGWLIPASALLFSFFLHMMRSGIGSSMGGANFWVSFLTSVALIIAAVVLLYYLSVALISPPSANRALPLRVYVTALWFVGGALSIYWAFRTREIGLILPWAIAVFVILAAATVVVVSNNDQLSLRVRRRIPSNPFKRALAFLYFNGAAGGLAWVGLLMGMTFLVTVLWLTFLPKFFSGFHSMTPVMLRDFRVTAAATILYVFAYALTAVFLHRQLFAQRSPRLAGVLAVLLPALWALIPKIVLFFLNNLSFRSLERLQLGDAINIGMVRDHSDKLAHLACAAAWLALMLILNGRWFARQVKEFKPLAATQPATTTSAAPAPPPVPTHTGAVGT